MNWCCYAIRHNWCVLRNYPSSRQSTSFCRASFRILWSLLSLLLLLFNYVILVRGDTICLWQLGVTGALSLPPFLSRSTAIQDFFQSDHGECAISHHISPCLPLYVSCHTGDRGFCLGKFFKYLCFHISWVCRNNSSLIPGSQILWKKKANQANTPSSL